MHMFVLHKFISKCGSVQHTQLSVKALLIIIYLFHAFAADFMTMLAIIFVELIREHTHVQHVYKYMLFWLNLFCGTQ